MGGKIMSISHYISDPITPCPHCHEIQCLSYLPIPKSILTYILNGENYTEYLPETKQYSCRSCSGEFILFPLHEEENEWLYGDGTEEEFI
jgi:hypothetical protein